MDKWRIDSRFIIAQILMDLAGLGISYLAADPRKGSSKPLVLRVEISRKGSTLLTSLNIESIIKKSTLIKSGIAGKSIV
jgi:hypothetical protein